MLVGVLMLSSLLGIGYLLPIPLRAFFFDPPASPAREHGHGHGHDHDHGHAQDHEHGEAHPLMLVPLSLTAVGCLLLFFYSQHVVALLRPLVTP